MAADPIAARYAAALCESLGEDRARDAVAAQLNELDALLKTEPDFGPFLRNPDVESDEKVAVCARVWPGGMRDEVRDGLRLIFSHDRAAWLASIIEAFRALVDVAQHRVRVTVYAARPLSLATTQRLIERLTQREGCSVLLTEETHPELLGGAQIHVGHRLIDGSLRTQLTELRHRLKQVRVA